MIKYDSEINNLSNHSRIRDPFLIKGKKKKGITLLDCANKGLTLSRKINKVFTLGKEPMGPEC